MKKIFLHTIATCLCVGLLLVSCEDKNKNIDEPEKLSTEIQSMLMGGDGWGETYYYEYDAAGKIVKIERYEEGKTELDRLWSFEHKLDGWIEITRNDDAGWHWKYKLNTAGAVEFVTNYGDDWADEFQYKYNADGYVTQMIQRVDANWVKRYEATYTGKNITKIGYFDKTGVSEGERAYTYDMQEENLGEVYQNPVEEGAKLYYLFAGMKVFGKASANLLSQDQEDDKTRVYNYSYDLQGRATTIKRTNKGTTEVVSRFVYTYK